METGQPTMFADLLKQYRLTAGLTQEALAERARVSRKAVSALECGTRQAPRRDTVRLLADALGLPPEGGAALAAAATTRPRAVPSTPPAHAATHHAPPSNLPAPPTPLIGRADDVTRAGALLRGAAVRLLTLVGPAGVGKTRLGLEVAVEFLPAFADGVFLVALAPLTDPTLVASAVAGALGVREQGGRPLQDILVEYLDTKRTLLLLDNFEHVTAAAPLLAALLAACPHLRLLVTSRAPVRVRGEQVLPVAPLALPDLAHLPLPEDLARVPAVALFVARAGAVAPDFALTAANAPAVAAICARLDGLPLAIELAAARITLLPPRALLARLEHNLSLLVGGARDLPERQQTLHAAIAWSYNLLHAGEQALFRRLAVFAGGASLEAVEAVCHTAGDVEGDALEWLAGLVDKSLLRREEGPDGEPRVGMLETIRGYAREHLAASGEAEVTERAHAEYYVALAERAEPELTGPEQAVWLARLEREHDNLRATLRWAHESEESEIGLRVAGALWRFWSVRGFVSEGWRAMEMLLDDGAEAAPAVRARALNGAGNLARDQGGLARAAALYEESLALWRNLDDRAGTAQPLNNLGLVARDHGEFARAQGLFEESLALRRDLGDRVGIAQSLNNLGLVAHDQGDYARASALHEESLAQRRELDDTAGIAFSLDNLGLVAYAQGNLARAGQLHEESLALKRELGDKWAIAASLINLGIVAHAQGNNARARTLLEESLALHRELGGTRYVAECLEYLAQVLAAQAQLGRAAYFLGASEALRARIVTPLPPANKVTYDRSVAFVRGTLGDDAFAAAWAAGAALSLDQAIALALGQ